MFFIKKIQQVFLNIHFQSLFGNAVMAILGMVTFSILYRSLSVYEIGVYLFLTTMLNLVDTVKSGFLTTTFINFYSGTDKEKANEVAGSAWSLAIALSLLMILVNLITFSLSSYYNNPAIIIFLKYFSIIALFGLPYFMASIVVQGEKRFDRLLWLRLVYQLLFVGIVIALLFFKKANLNTIIITYAASNLVASLIILLLGWTKIETIKYSSVKTFWELFHFGKYSMGTSLSSNLFAVTDTFFINFFLGPAALAIYNLGSKLLQIVEMPLLSLAASGMPSLSEYYNNNQKLKMMYLMKKLIGMLSIVIIGIAILSVTFAEPIIMIIGGAKYIHTEAPQLFRILMSITILYPADRFFALTLDVIHKPKINFYKILVMLVVNLLADYIGLKIFKSVYVIAIANLFPVIAAILISYKPLNAYSKLNFWSIYTIGFKEIVLFIKNGYDTINIRNKVINNK